MKPNKNNNDNNSKLLWVKVPEPHATKLKDTAEKIGISRADFMRLILINFVSNETNSISISTQK
jgi:hypothetical protein